MNRHLSANLWLLGLTLLLCAVLYPLALLGVGRVLFAGKANGSLLTDAEGKPVGSRLVAQPFSGDEYFQPRPSAVSHNAAATGGTNWGANNPALRKRVLAQLGTVLKYGPKGRQPGRSIGPDLEAWFGKDRFQDKPGIVTHWAETNPDAAAAWVKAAELNAEYVKAWRNAHRAEVDQWVKDNPDTPEPKPEDLAVVFFKSFSASDPGTFPDAVEVKTADGKTEKRIEPVKEGSVIRSLFFDLWYQEHPSVDLEPVPADMVMASGSGLDPHITMKNALYQLDRVAAAWSEKTKVAPERVAQAVRELLQEKKEAPLGGLVGVDLVNVLEVNLALPERMQRLSRTP